MMYFTGFADEAGKTIDVQIKATKELGWTNIESRAIEGINMTDITDAKFDEVAGKLKDAGVTINCFGSAVANWAKYPDREEDFQKSIEELTRALPRMKRLGTKYIRAMSFKMALDNYPPTPEIEKEIFRKVTHLSKMCEDAGVMYLHENCMNYGGLSQAHTLKLIENIKSKAFKLVFDTGNPVAAYDRQAGLADKRQSAWEFYSAVRDHIEYVHIKDGVFKDMPANGFYANVDWKYPGEGEGDVIRIIDDMVKRGYDGGFSIEPHMALVFHDTSIQSPEAEMYRIYVEYGKRFMTIVENAKKKAGK
ncbi:MAG: sugar phosphate isomerase/epimerase family protein [Spirochaetota bacterium]